MKRTSEMVYLIEDDSCVRGEVSHFLTSAELEVLSFESAASFLTFDRSDECACLVVEMDLKDIDGLELQQRLVRESAPPIIFMSERNCVRSTVSAMKAGAVEVLTRPIDTPALLTAIDTALAQDRRMRRRRACREQLQERFSSLTPRQREVFPLVIGGLLNKQAAAILEISEVTLQIHRSQLMRKMAAESLADLVRMAVELRIPHWRQPLHEQRR